MNTLQTFFNFYRPRYVTRPFVGCAGGTSPQATTVFFCAIDIRNKRRYLALKSKQAQGISVIRLRKTRAQPAICRRDFLRGKHLAGKSLLGINVKYALFVVNDVTVKSHRQVGAEITPVIIKEVA